LYVPPTNLEWQVNLGSGDYQKEINKKGRAISDLHL